jgi:uncharacterized metal-binding protein YceD (DUF177 family)
MRHNREFEIAWQGLKPGEHVYEYEVDDQFIDTHGERTDFIGLKAEVKLKFDKQPTFFKLHFDIGGTVKVPCDRCGDEFTLSLWDEFDLLVKLSGEDAENLDEEADIVFIPRSETVLDISSWMYEFVLLSIPLQRVHPGLLGTSGGCNPEAIRLLNMLSENPEQKPANNIWKGLEALRNQEKKEL